MEAMVVCKKGVKAHPDRPDPRLLLARVYAEQGKDKKALEELQGALGVAPTDRAVLRALAGVQLRSGDAAAGKATLLKAWEIRSEGPRDRRPLHPVEGRAAEAAASAGASACAGPGHLAGPAGSAAPAVRGARGHRRHSPGARALPLGERHPGAALGGAAAGARRRGRHAAAEEGRMPPAS